MVGFTGLDIGNEGPQGFERVGEVPILLPTHGYVPVAVGVGAEAEAVARVLAEGGFSADSRHGQVS